MRIEPPFHCITGTLQKHYMVACVILISLRQMLKKDGQTEIGEGEKVINNRWFNLPEEIYTHTLTLTHWQQNKHKQIEPHWSEHQVQLTPHNRSSSPTVCPTNYSRVRPSTNRRACQHISDDQWKTVSLQWQ